MSDPLDDYEAFRYFQALEKHLKMPQGRARSAAYSLLRRGMPPLPDAIHDELVRRGTLDPGAIGAMLTDNILVIKRLGKGGMGEVFKAVKIDIERFCAIKLVSNPDLADRLLKEGLVGSQPEHPSIVRTENSGRSRFGPFLVLEFIEGFNLASPTANIPVRVVLQCGIEIAAALHVLHSSAPVIIHRDLKPANVMYCPDRGNFILADFGIATTIDEADPLHKKAKVYASTDTGHFLGSLPFASPEQLLDSRSVDHRSDIWGLGALLFAMITGRPPLSLAEAMTIREKGIGVAPPLSLSGIPVVPAKLAETISRMLSVRATDRFQTALDAKRALQECIVWCNEKELADWYEQFPGKSTLSQMQEWIHDFKVE